MMKNSFDFDVCFKDYPIQPYEWDRHSSIIHMKLNRVSTCFLKDILSFEGKIENAKSKILLLSDTKEAIALKLNKDGRIVKRSFLNFDKSLEICEFAYNLKETKLNFKKDGKRVEYPKCRSVEEEVKDYIVETIEKVSDEDFEKYIYYFYCDDVKGYSRDKLLSSIEHAPLEVNMKLYRFLIES